MLHLCNPDCTLSFISSSYRALRKQIEMLKQRKSEWAEALQKLGPLPGMEASPGIDLPQWQPFIDTCPFSELSNDFLIRHSRQHIYFPTSEQLQLACEAHISMLCDAAISSCLLM